MEQSKLPRLLQEDEDEDAQADSGVQSFEIDPEKVMVRLCQLAFNYLRGLHNASFM